MLTVSDLDAFYGRAQALFGVALSVEAGTVTALIGRNGAGKSTTLKTIMGLVPPARGRIHVGDTRIDGLPPYRVARHGLGYVPEDRRVFADLTVAENLETGRRPAAAGRRPWRTDDVYDLFPNLRDLFRRPAGRISGGEQQMLAVGRTLMGNPRLLILDEPSEGLAPVVVQAMSETIQTLSRQGVTILMSEQNPAFARGVAGRGIVIEKGRVVQSGPMTTMNGEDRTGGSAFGSCGGHD